MSWLWYRRPPRWQREKPKPFLYSEECSTFFNRSNRGFQLDKRENLILACVAAAMTAKLFHYQYDYWSHLLNPAPPKDGCCECCHGMEENAADVPQPTPAAKMAGREKCRPC